MPEGLYETLCQKNDASQILTAYLKRSCVKTSVAKSPGPVFIDTDSPKNTLGARFRKTRPGPELELIETFLGAMPLHIPKGCRATVFREPRLESGFPDLVIVVWREEVTLSWRPERECLQTQDLRLIHFLHYA